MGLASSDSFHLKTKENTKESKQKPIHERPDGLKAADQRSPGVCGVVRSWKPTGETHPFRGPRAPFLETNLVFEGLIPHGRINVWSPEFCDKNAKTPGPESCSILFKHRSFQKPMAVSTGF